MSDLNYAEVVLLVVLVAFSYKRPSHHSFPSRRWDLPVARSVFYTGVGAILLRLALLPLVPIPHPLVPDEFSHRLLGETFANLHWTNPTHPLWRHFESIHIIPKPAYASMYFPLQGLFLAIGFLLGHAWLGVLLSTGLLCAALTWMLYGWLPPRWALLGGCLGVVRFGLLSYWVNSYWGGAHAALGGALVLGAAVRLRRRFSWSATIALGTGMGLLLLGRPLEGGVLCAATLAWLVTQTKPLATLPRLAPSLVILAIAATFLGLYCWHVTGSPTVVPYQINQKLYGWPMTLITYTPPGNLSEHPALRHYYDWELAEHDKLRHHFVTYTIERAQLLWRFFFGPLLSLSLLSLPWLLRDRRMRPLWWILAAAIGILLLEQTGYPHYLAPATGILLILTMQGLRHLRQYRPQDKPVGATMVRLLPYAIGLIVVARLAGMPLLTLVQHANFTSWCCSLPGYARRTEIEHQLQRHGGRHVLLVRSRIDHYDTREWVYNHPNIDASPVIWARDMGTENAELRRYFPDRQFWLVDVDASPAQLSSCSDAKADCQLLP